MKEIAKLRGAGLPLRTIATLPATATATATAKRARENIRRKGSAHDAVQFRHDATASPLVQPPRAFACRARHCDPVDVVCGCVRLPGGHAQSRRPIRSAHVRGGGGGVV